MDFRYRSESAWVRRLSAGWPTLPDGHLSRLSPDPDAESSCEGITLEARATTVRRVCVPNEGGVIQTLVLTFSFVTLMAACFGLSCLAHLHLAATLAAAPQGPLGDLWDGVLP